MTKVRRAATAQLAEAELETVRRLVFGAFGGRFDEHDWEHTLGGVHVMAMEDGAMVAHGAVVPRVLEKMAPLPTTLTTPAPAPANGMMRKPPPERAPGPRRPNVNSRR